MFSNLDTETILGEAIIEDTKATMPEDSIIDNFYLTALYKTLKELDEDERKLIWEIFFCNKSLGQYAKEIDAAKSSVHNQKGFKKIKKKIIKNLGRLTEILRKG